MIIFLLLSCLTCRLSAEAPQDINRADPFLDYLNASPPNLYAGDAGKKMKERAKEIQSIQQKIIDFKLSKETIDKLKKLANEPIHFNDDDTNMEDIHDNAARERVENLIRQPSRRSQSNLHNTLRNNLPIIRQEVQNLTRLQRPFRSPTKQRNRSQDRRMPSKSATVRQKSDISRTNRLQRNQHKLRQQYKYGNEATHKTTISGILEYLKKRSEQPDNFPLDLELHKKMRERAAKGIEGLDNFNPYAVVKAENDNDYAVEMKYLYGLSDEDIPQFSPPPGAPSTPEMPSLAPLELDRAGIHKLFESSDDDDVHPNLQLISNERTRPPYNRGRHLGGK